MLVVGRYCGISQGTHAISPQLVRDFRMLASVLFAIRSSSYFETPSTQFVPPSQRSLTSATPHVNVNRFMLIAVKEEPVAILFKYSRHYYLCNLSYVPNG